MEAVSNGVVYRELAKPSPRNRLVPLVKVIEAVAWLSNGKISIPEACDAMTRCYDGDSMMLYCGLGYGLAEPIDGNPYSENSGFNERGDVVCEILNSRFWKIPDAIVAGVDPMGVEDFLIAKSDGFTLANRIWDAMMDFDGHGGEPFPYDDYCGWSDWLLPFKTISKNEVSGTVSGTAIPKPRGKIPTPSNQWPWGDHHTATLGHLEAAALRYYGANYDPSDATTVPTNATVSEWLQTSRKVSKTMADAIASMLRPDGLPTGPRK